jgi:hypothetical protein
MLWPAYHRHLKATVQRLELEEEERQQLLRLHVRLNKKLCEKDYRSKEYFEQDLLELIVLYFIVYQYKDLDFFLSEDTEDE